MKNKVTPKTFKRATQKFVRAVHNYDQAPEENTEEQMNALRESYQKRKRNFYRSLISSQILNKDLPDIDNSFEFKDAKKEYMKDELKNIAGQYNRNQKYLTPIALKRAQNLQKTLGSKIGEYMAADIVTKYLDPYSFQADASGILEPLQYYNIIK